MSFRRRLLVAATALAVVFLASAPPSLGLTGRPTTVDQSEETGPQADPTPGSPVVHSWALAPAGTSGDPDQPGNRPTFSYEVEPGAEIEDALTLFNFSNVKLTFRLYATDAFNTETGQFALLSASEAPTDVGSWISLPTTVVTVLPESQITVPITMRVPAGATPGDHVGAVLAASDATGTGADGKTVTLDRRTGSRVYVRVAGAVKPELAIANVHTTYKPSLNPLGGTATVTYRIVNRGNVRLSGRHRASVAGPFGLGRKRSPEEDLPELLPGESITVVSTFDGVPATALEFTEVRVEPSTVLGEDPDLPAESRSSITFAPPLTIVLPALAAWLALRARRAYAKHRRDAQRAHIQPT